jgi:hypothetical protein
LKSNILKSVLFVLVSIELSAQTYKHVSLWSRFAIQKPVKNWNFRVEMDIRQQNDFQKSDINPFQKPSLRWLRLNSNYTTGRFIHTLIMPQYSKLFPIIGKKEDLLRSPSFEWRYTFNEEYSIPYKNLNSVIRLGYEFRNITTDGITRNTGRTRIRLAETLVISEKSSVNMSFELLYNSGPNKSANTFNSSQLAFRYLHKFGKNINFTTGINHNYRQRNTLIEYDSENAVLCNFIIDI